MTRPPKRVEVPPIAPDIPRVEDHFRALLTSLAPHSEWQDPLLDIGGSAERVARMWVNELLAGYADGADAALVKDFKVFPFPEGETRTQGIVTVKKIPYASTCAHHLLPFRGYAHVAYIPNNFRGLAGYSKIPRVVAHYAAMLQVQERLTRQVLDFLQEHLSPVGLLVVTEATHGCMELRGVRTHGAETGCAEIAGAAETPSTRTEMYRLLGL